MMGRWCKYTEYRAGENPALYFTSTNRIISIIAKQF